MNAEQLKARYKDYGHIIKHLSKRSSKLSELWMQMKQRVTPHANGTMPPAIRKAFPNETQKQYEYRKSIHESKTQSKLEQAVDQVQAMLMGGKFRVETSDGRLKDWLEGDELEGQRLIEWMTSELYPTRVSDPNAIVVAFPARNVWSIASDDERLAESEAVPVELKIIPSENVIAYPAKHGFWAYSFNSYEAFFITDTHYIWVYYDSEKSEMVYVDLYEHNAEYPLVTPVGGVMCQKTYDGQSLQYYKSDFDFAVPVMNDVATLDNQLKAITVNTCFPTRVTRGVECPSCEGMGYVKKYDSEGNILYAESGGPEMAECGTCKGRKQVAMSALDGLMVVTPKSIGEQKTDTSGDIASQNIAYVSPPTENVKEIREQRNEELRNLEQVLHLVKQANANESGVAKREDKEDKYNRLQQIAGSLSGLARSILESVLSLLYFNEPDSLQRELEELKIHTPNSFDLKSAEEIEQEFYENLPSKPSPLRIKEFDDLMAKKYENLPLSLRASKLWSQLCMGLHVYTKEELDTLEGSGFVSVSDVQKVLIGFFLISQEIARDRNASDETIIQRVDDRVSQFALSVQPVTLENGE